MRESRILLNNAAVVESTFRELGPGFTTCFRYEDMPDPAQAARVAQFVAPTEYVAQRLEKKMLANVRIKSPPDGAPGSTTRVQWEQVLVSVDFDSFFVVFFSLPDQMFLFFLFCSFSFPANLFQFRLFFCRALCTYVRKPPSLPFPSPQASVSLRFSCKIRSERFVPSLAPQAQHSRDYVVWTCVAATGAGVGTAFKPSIILIIFFNPVLLPSESGIQCELVGMQQMAAPLESQPFFGHPAMILSATHATPVTAGLRAMPTRWARARPVARSRLLACDIRWPREDVE